MNQGRLNHSRVLLRSLGALLPGRCRGAAAEAVLEAARHRLEVAHAAHARRAAAPRLPAPVVRAHLLCRITAACAGFLLVVEGAFATAEAYPMGFFVALAHGRGAVPTATEPENKMQRGLLLDVVVGEGATILELLACEYQPLLVWRNAFLVLYLSLHVVNGVRRLHVQSNRLPCQCFHEDLHHGYSNLMQPWSVPCEPSRLDPNLEP